MTVLSAMQSAAVRLLGRRPTVFFGAGSGQTFELEISDLVNEVATDIAKYQDWQALVRIAQFTGDGTKVDFAKPDDYDRMMQTADIQDTANWMWGYRAFTDMNAFIYEQARGFAPYPGGWILYEDQFHFTPAPTPGAPAVFPYITKNWAASSSGAPKSQFDNDADTFKLSERLLTLGLVWRWRADIKKLDATGDQEAFIKALDEDAGKDKGARVYRRNSRRYLPGVGIAWPWTLG